MDPMGLVKRALDQRLRRELLRMLHASRGERDGWITAFMLVKLYGPKSAFEDHAESEGHVMTLLTDLVRKGYAEKTDDRQYQWQEAKLGFIRFRITDRGISLAEQTIAPDPDIEDDRLPQ